MTAPLFWKIEAFKANDENFESVIYTFYCEPKDCCSVDLITDYLINKNLRVVKTTPNRKIKNIIEPIK